MMIMPLGLPWGVLGLAFICCLLPARGVTAGSSFAFDVYGGQEECFREDIVLRSLHSDLFLHFELLEPRGPADALHVKLLSPSGVPVTTWAHATANNTSLQLRESGLYSLCFTSTPGSKAHQRVLYVADVVSYGTRSLTRDPTVVATLHQQTPDEPSPSTLTLATERGVPVSMGVVEYSFAGISLHALHDNARSNHLFSIYFVFINFPIHSFQSSILYLFHLNDLPLVSPYIHSSFINRVIASFAVDFASKPGIEVTLAAIPDHRLVHPPTWTSMATHIESFYDRLISNHGVLASTGGSLLFDITDVVRAATAQSESLAKQAGDADLATSPSTVAFSIQVAEDGDVRLAAGARKNGEYATPSESFLIRRRRPTLSVEDLGLPVLQSIGRFRYAVWDLKGELISIIQHERRSRDAAESVQDRLVVGAVLTNALWVGAALYQVLYVRRLLARG
ncbi:hypothetical protein, variant 1 [Aphanomyces astaci]|uniref:GOLD domain-containing protein n=1 Tax=Aphanomyces astaci TaxID=112090 RepID=W4GPZ0_APHAT|nr:hypothetical protein, variant 1 [Aphanomyces astaci]ETV81054.1 hypothetical protein, variant 1 [Aphanomyces astaci]|eukprot:XP_009828914.1 hypothetical protein, variant 1 [Aphanomyces astaci]